MACQSCSYITRLCIFFGTNYFSYHTPSFHLLYTSSLLSLCLISTPLPFSATYYRNLRGEHPPIFPQGTDKFPGPRETIPLFRGRGKLPSYIFATPHTLMADLNTHHLSLKIASQNAQGLNSPSKQRKAFQSYHARSLDIVLLPETHFPASYTPSFLHHNFPTFCLANADSKRRGVAIHS